MLFVCARCRQSMDLPRSVGAVECPACGGALAVASAATPPAVAPARPTARARTRAEPHVAHGLAATRAGDYGRAVREFTQALQIDPSSTRALNNRGFAYSACRDYGRAIADFDTALRLDPDFAPALNNRGLAF